MDLKSRLKNVLFEPEVETGKEKPKEVPASQSSPSPTSTVNEVELDREILDKIEQKIQNSDLPGPDYLELKSAAEEKSLIQDEPDEGKRWRQAFRNMRVFFPQAQITKAKILEAIDHYIRIVVKENEIGLSELESIRSRNVVDEQKSVERLDKEIQELESLLESKRKEREEKSSKIQANRDKYDSQERVFKKTIEYAKNMLERDKEKVNKYIND